MRAPSLKTALASWALSINIIIIIIYYYYYIWDMLLADFKLECLICSFLSFFQREIIVCLSFVERWDRFFFSCFTDMAIGLVFT